MIKPDFRKDIGESLATLVDDVKDFFLEKEMKYLSELHKTSSYSPEVQADLKKDVKTMLENIFDGLGPEIEGVIEDTIEDFQYDFESALSDNQDAHEKKHKKTIVYEE